MKIALIDTYDAWTHASLALHYLEGYALLDPDLAGLVEVRVFSLPQGQMRRSFMAGGRRPEVLEDLLAIGPDLVGLSCYVWNFWDLLQLAAWLKAHLPRTLVVLGGPEVSSHTLAGRVLQEFPQVDFIVLGEGEIPFRRLLGYLSQVKGQLQGIPGLAWRTSQGEAAFGPPGEVLENLDELPSPILRGNFFPQSDCLLWETYRGCPNRCRYCTWSHQRHRRFALDRLLAELDVLLASHVQQVYVVDPLFGPDRNRAEKILDHMLLRRREGMGLPGLFIFPDIRHLDLAFARKLQEANCTVSFGLQSTNPRAITLANRRHDLPALARALDLANRHFPRYDVDLIYGLPGDEYADFLASFNWLTDRQPPEIHCHRLTVLPGSVFDEEAAVYGLAFQEWPPHELLATKTMSTADLDKLERFAAGVQRFYNQAPVTFGCMREATWLAAADLIWNFIAWLEGEKCQDGSEPEAGAGDAVEQTFGLLRRYLTAQFATLDDQEQALLMAALAFDRACHRRWKKSYFNPLLEPERDPDLDPNTLVGPPWPELVEKALNALRKKITFRPGRELLDQMRRDGPDHYWPVAGA